MEQTQENDKIPNKKRKHLVFDKPIGYQESLDELLNISLQLLPQFGSKVWNRNSLLTLNAPTLARILYLDNLYRKIIDVPGVVCEFGVQWGATLTQLINLRSIHEPFNVSRTIYGFDTFEGFPSTHSKDGDEYRVGDLATLENYEEKLEEILNLIESFPPCSNIKKFSLIKGDVCNTIDKWLEDNPHAIISMAIFDMDLYEPTKYVLERIAPRLTKGSIIAFDELNCKFFPGETRALDEVLGINNLRLKRSAYTPYSSWAVYGD